MIKADGGALVYIILAVISLIVSAIGKSKSKGVPQISTEPRHSEQKAEPVDSQTTWQKELEDIFGKVIPVPEVKQEVLPKTKESGEQKGISTEITSMNVAERNLTAPSMKAGVEIHRPETHPEPLVVEDEHETLVSAEEFDLSRAVVYSEVLNRKYF